MRQPSLRVIVRALHKWLGLTLGLLFVVLGVTGSVLAFYTELDLLLNPGLAVQLPARSVELGRVVDLLRSDEPMRDGAWRIELPDSASSPIRARYVKPVETAHRLFAPLVVTIDPNTLTITSKRFWGDDPLTWIYDLHYSLLLESSGKTLLGLGACLILLLSVCGLYLWWPRPGRWRAALAFKTDGSLARRIYDLHVVPGAYAFAFSIVLTVTGLLLVVPGWFTPAINAVSPLTEFYRGGGERGAMEVSADRVLTVAQARFPGGSIRWVETPGKDRGVWRVQIRQDGEPNRRFPRTNVWLDAASGEVLAIRDPRQNSSGDTFMDWWHPLHNGEVFGLAGRVIVCLAGLLPALAYLTGFLLWRRKAKASSRMRYSENQVVEETGR